MSTAVPYFDLQRQYEKLKNELDTLLLQTAASGRYVLGPAVEEFEKAFASYCGVPFGVGVGSGTDALAFSLRALGIKKGDEVIVPSFTFSASVLCVLQADATPVYADIDPETYTLSPDSAEKVLTKRAKAILPVHLFGQCAEMDALNALAKKRKLKVIEDACQAHGALYQGKKAGALGDAGCFSFYPTKNLGAMGDGGMMVTKNKKIMESVLRYRNLGRRELKDPHQEMGWTSRLDALQAMILNLKLKNLELFNEDRRRVAAHYFKRLETTPLMLPREGEGRRHVYHLFVVRVPGGKRGALRARLAQKGIPTMLHYPVPVHRQPFARLLSAKTKHLKVTEQISKETLSLPMFPDLTNEEVDRVCDAILSFYHAR